MIGVSRHWFAVASCALLVSCGGGGGGGGGSDGAPPTSGGGTTTPVNVVGRLEWPASAGVWRPGAAHEVRLVTIDDNGQRLDILARATTNAAGQFSLAPPSSWTPGLRSAVEAESADGTSVRALATQAHVDLSPASQAFTDAVLATGIQRQANSGVLSRIARFQNATGQLLRLSPPRATGTAAAIAELKSTMAEDRWASLVLDTLTRQGQMPATLGDIGSLFGLGAGRLDYTDTDDGNVQIDVQPAAAADEFTVRKTLKDKAGQPYSEDVYRLANDAVWLSRSGTNSVNAELVAIVGAMRSALVGLVEGETTRLVEFSGSTGAYTFDADNLPDQMTLRVDMTYMGVESIDTSWGRVAAAARFDQVQSLSITLSTGGKLAATVRTSEWRVPNGGLLKSQTTSEATEATGAKTTLNSTAALVRGLLDGVSWPHRARITSVDIRPEVTAPRQMPLSVTSRGDVGWAFLGTSSDPRLVMALFDARDGRQTASLTLTSPNPWFFDRVVVSPDGSKYYAVFGGNRVSSGDGNQDMTLPLAEADRRGAVIVRIDAATLREEARIVLPAVPSTLLPGRGFVRGLVRDLAISPVDPNRFAVAADGVVVVDGTAPLSQPLQRSGVEFGTPDGGARLLSDQARVRGWDATSNQVWVEIDGQVALMASTVGALGLSWGTTQTLPIAAFKNHLASPFGSFGAQGFDGVVDWIDSGAFYLGAFSQAGSRQTGGLVGSYYFVAVDSSYRPCALRGASLYCLSAEGLARMGQPTLTIQAPVDLVIDFRQALGQASTWDSYWLFPISGDEFIVASTTTIRRVRLMAGAP